MSHRFPCYSSQINAKLSYRNGNYNSMGWNWTQTGWPHFTYDLEPLQPLERQFLKSSGEIIGAVRHFDEDDGKSLRIELLSDEAVKTSEIEGEMLDRLSAVVFTPAVRP